MSLHENSIKSREYEKAIGRSDSLRKQIFDLLAKGGLMTDREIATRLHEPDLNNIRPEITRLKDAGLVGEAGHTRCTRTRRKVRLVRALTQVYDEARVKKQKGRREHSSSRYEDHLAWALRDLSPASQKVLADALLARQPQKCDQCKGYGFITTFSQHGSITYPCHPCKSTGYINTPTA